MIMPLLTRVVLQTTDAEFPCKSTEMRPESFKTSATADSPARPMRLWLRSKALKLPVFLAALARAKAPKSPT